MSMLGEIKTETESLRPETMKTADLSVECAGEADGSKLESGHLRKGRGGCMAGKGDEG